MSTPVRLAGFLLALVVVFLGARGVGAVTNPVVDEPAVAVDHEAMTEESAGESAEESAGHDEDHGEEHEPEEAAAGHTPGGLQSSEEGYSLRVLGREPLRFVVEGPDGHAVTAYDVVHEQPLHLIKIRRDGAGFEHVHPTMAPDGTWTARVDLEPGSTRVFADFTPTGGPALVLGTDVEVAGDYRPQRPPPVTTTTMVGDYELTVEGELVPGEASPVTVSVSKDGEPVTDLQPYLGAYGHLVALREGDLAYLHVHPDEASEQGAGPQIPFLAEVPSAGRYRLFLDFRHDGVVRTAAFTLSTAGGDHAH